MKQVDTTEFLNEIIKKCGDRTDSDTHVIERPEFMALRCERALEKLPDRLRKEAEIGTHGFISSLPLYDFDLIEPPSSDRHPDLSDVKSQPFKEFVYTINDMGFQCFIGRPNLPPTGEVTDWWNSGSHGLLGDLGMTMIVEKYLDSVGAVGEQRDVKQFTDWTLYVLLPGKTAPGFNPKPLVVGSSEKSRGLLRRLTFLIAPFAVVATITLPIFFSCPENIRVIKTLPND